MPKIALRHILKEDILTVQPDNHSVMLTEPNNSNRPQTLKEVEIIDIPDDTLILCVDKMSSPLFREHSICTCHAIKKYRKNCDYIIITNFEGINYIVYIEMKTSPREQKHIPQLWCGRSFIEYLSFAMEKIEDILPLSSFTHRFVKFCTIPEDKDSTDNHDEYKLSNQPKELNDLPGKAYPYYVTAGVPVPLKDLIYEYNH